MENRKSEKLCRKNIVVEKILRHQKKNREKIRHFFFRFPKLSENKQADSMQDSLFRL